MHDTLDSAGLSLMKAIPASERDPCNVGSLHRLVSPEQGCGILALA